MIAWTAVSVVGTPRFVAPEVSNQARLTHYGMAVDVFSTGVVFLYVFGIELPFGGYSSEYDSDRSVGGDIERPIGLAQSEEKATALKTARIMSAFKAEDWTRYCGLL